MNKAEAHGIKFVGFSRIFSGTIRKSQ
jgi:ribosome assembly protein 1